MYCRSNSRHFHPFWHRRAASSRFMKNCMWFSQLGCGTLLSCRFYVNSKSVYANLWKKNSWSMGKHKDITPGSRSVSWKLVEVGRLYFGIIIPSYFSFFFFTYTLGICWRQGTELAVWLNAEILMLSSYNTLRIFTRKFKIV